MMDVAGAQVSFAGDTADMVETVRRLEAESGYRLAGAFVGDVLQAVAGYRAGDVSVVGGYGEGMRSS